MSLATLKKDFSLESDVWSRRITLEQRCAYLVKADRIEFLQSRYY